MANEAIAAIATAPGRGGIGIVRISGPTLDVLLQGLVGRPVAPRHASLHDFLDGEGGVIDQGLVLWFPAPHSYTGEDVIELQGHGGPVVLNLILRRCLALGARLAEPGEFTKRAYLNDRLDLAQAESVADLIDAVSEQAARSAVRSLQGTFSEQIVAMVDALTNLRMLVEATLDFPEEEVEFLERGRAREKLAAIQMQLAGILAGSRQGRLLREGIQVVLAGAPNVGKSSLLNALAGIERAIVTEIPGTTRDAIHETIVVEGIPLHVIDTAGLRESHDPVERIGIERTLEAIRNADFLLWVSDLTRPETRAIDSRIAGLLARRASQIHVMNKMDLAAVASRTVARDGAVEIPVSAKFGEGLDRLRSEILTAAGWAGPADGLYMARERHLQALEAAQQHLNRAWENPLGLEVFAEELRLGQIALGSITGEFTPDDLLGRIFATFCIGK